MMFLRIYTHQIFRQTEQESRLIYDFGAAGSFAPNEDWQNLPGGSFGPSESSGGTVYETGRPATEADKIRAKTSSDLNDLRSQMPNLVERQKDNPEKKDFLLGLGDKVNSLAESFFSSEGEGDDAFEKKMMGVALIAGILSLFNRGGTGTAQKPLMSADGQYKMDGSILPESASDPLGTSKYERILAKQDYEKELMIELKETPYKDLLKKYGDAVQALTLQLDNKKMGYVRRDVLEGELMEARDKQDVLQGLRAKRIGELQSLNNFFREPIRNHAKNLREFPDAEDLNGVAFETMTPEQQQMALWRAGTNVAMKLCIEGEFVMDPSSLQFSYAVENIDNVDAIVAMEQEFYRLGQKEGGKNIPYLDRIAELWKSSGRSVELVHPITQRKIRVSQGTEGAYRLDV